MCEDTVDQIPICNQLNAIFSKSKKKTTSMTDLFPRGYIVVQSLARKSATTATTLRCKYYQQQMMDVER